MSAIVLHVIQNLNYGGMERVLADLVRNTDRDRYEAQVLTLQYRGRFERGLPQTTVVHDGPGQGRLSILRPAALAAQLRQIRPEIVHTHSGVWYKVARAARMAGVPSLIHTEHGRGVPDPLASRVVDCFASRHTDMVVAVSQPLATYMREAIVWRRTEVRTIPNGIDVARFYPGRQGRLRQVLGLPDDVAVIGSIGRLEPIKGYDVLVEAFHQYCQVPENPRAVLVVGGDGSERNELIERARTRGLAERVHFLGWRDDTEDLLGSFSIFTLTSRSEGTSISLLEAMASGLCCIVTDVGGNAEVLGPALTECLVPSEDPPGIAERWARVLSSKSTLLDCGRKARERVVRKFSLGSMVAQYHEAYDEIRRRR